MFSLIKAGEYVINWFFTMLSMFVLLILMLPSLLIGLIYGICEEGFKSGRHGAEQWFAFTRDETDENEEI